MKVFYLIMIASVISLVLRVLPVLLLRNLNFDKFRISETLDLASSCIIGQIIYLVAFNNKNIFLLIDNISMVDYLNVICIALSFLVCYYSKSIMKAIFAVLTIYALIIFLN